MYILEAPRRFHTFERGTKARGSPRAACGVTVQIARLRVIRDLETPPATAQATTGAVHVYIWRLFHPAAELGSWPLVVIVGARKGEGGKALAMSLRVQVLQARLSLVGTGLPIS